LLDRLQEQVCERCQAYEITIKQLRISTAAHKAELQLAKLELAKLKTTMPTDGISNFGVDNLLQIEHKQKGVFKFYTGITYIRFTFLLSFLTSVASVKYEA